MPEEIVHNVDNAEGTTVEAPQDVQPTEDAPKLSRFQTNVNRTLEFYNNQNSDKYKDVQKRIEDSGLTMDEYRTKFVQQLDAVNGPNNPSIEHAMPDNDELSNIYDFQNSVWDDFATKFQSGLNRIGYGAGVVAPGMVAAFNESGGSPEWVEETIESMNDWYDRTEERTSEESQQSFFDTGSSRAFWGGLGQGAASMAPMVLSFIPYVGKPLYMATTFADVFGSILKNGKEHDLSLEDSARMALTLAVPITALEKIGASGVTTPMKKGFKRFLTKEGADVAITEAAKGTTKKTIGKELLDQTVRLTAKNAGRKKLATERALNIAKGFGHGAGYEGVTETLQSVVEQTGEQIFDTYKDEITSGKYGTKIQSWDFWKQAAEEGFYGAILGGVMSGGGAGSRSIRQQATYGYVRSSVEQGKQQNIEAIKNRAKQLTDQGKLTPEEYENYIATVDQMEKYEKLMWKGMDSPHAKYQAYNQMVTKNKADEVLKSDWLAEQGQFSTTQQKEITDLAESIKKDSENVIAAIIKGDKQVVEERAERDSKVGRKIEKTVFDVKENIHYAHNPVFQQLVAPELAKNIKRFNELVPKELEIDGFYNEQAANEGKIQASKDGVPLTDDVVKPFQNVAEFGGFQIPQEVLEDKEGFFRLYDKAKNTLDKEVTKEALKELKEQYGVDKATANYIGANRSMFDEENIEYKQVEQEETTEETTEEETETTPIKEQTIDPFAEPQEDVEETEVETIKRYSPEVLKENPDKVYLFGDNLVGKGKAGQAVIRDEPNAFGIPTKKAPSMDEDAFMTDDEYADNVKAIDEAFAKIPKGKTVVLPEDGLGTGLAKLEEKAPKTYAYIQEKIAELKKPKPTSKKEPKPTSKPTTEEKKAFKKKAKEDVEEQGGVGSIIKKGLERVGAKLKAVVTPKEEVVEETTPVEEITIKDLQNLAIALTGTDIIPKNTSLYSQEESLENKMKWIERNTPIRTKEDYSKAIEIAEKNMNPKITGLLESVYQYKFEGKTPPTKEETLESIDAKERTPREQRQSLLNNPNKNNSIQSNPELYEKIKKHFKRIFPNIPVKEVEILFQKHGVEVLGRLIESGIEIDPTKAIQTTLVHEYAHVFLEVLGDNHPLVKEGYRLIEGTSFDEEAKVLYADKSRAEQLHEALTESIAQDSLEKLKTKLDGTKYEQFKSWLKSIWSKIKKAFGSANQADITSILADTLTYKKTPYTIGLGSLAGINKNQNIAAVDPQQATAFGVLNTSLINLRLKALTSKDIDTKDVATVKQSTFKSLMQRYLQEKNGLVTGVQMFEEIYLDNVLPGNTLVGLTPLQADEKVAEFEKELKNKYPVTYGWAAKAINTIVDLDIIKDEDVDKIDELGDDDVNQNLDETPTVKTPIKKTVELSPSVRSIISTILDNDGEQLSADAIENYLAFVADNVDTTQSYNEFIEKLRQESDKIIPNRMLSVIESLEPGIRNGLLSEVTSLVQKEYESSMMREDETEDGLMHTVQNRTVNADTNYSDITNKIISWASNPLNMNIWKGTFGVYGDTNPTSQMSKILNEDPSQMRAVANVLSSMFGLDITHENIGELVSAYGTPLEFYKSMNSDYKSIATYVTGGEVDGKKLELKDVKSRINKVINTYEAAPTLVKGFLNTKGNAVTTTQLGDWISQLGKNIKLGLRGIKNNVKNKTTARMVSMMKNPLYQKNTVLEHFKKRGIRSMVFDALKNMNLNTVTEYADMSIGDYHISQLHKFASTTSKDFYNQSLGVISNRDTALYWQVPTYNTQAKLEAAYIDQANTYKVQLEKLIEKYPENKAKFIEDFNSLYLHQASLNDKGEVVVTNGMDVGYNEEIAKLKAIIPLALQSAYSQEKVNNKGIYKSFDELLENYFYTEALNRNYLGDIYSGLALMHSLSSKGAVENSIKRNSGLNSNGVLIPLDQPVIMVVHDGPSDSFAFNGTYLSERIDLMRGDLDKAGLSSKDQIFQVQPDTGAQLFVKNSSMNMKRTEGGHNLTNFSTEEANASGTSYKVMGDAVLAIEDYYIAKWNAEFGEGHGIKPYIKFMDKDAMKGTYEFDTIPLSTITKAVANGTIADIESQFSQVDVTNFRIPFNLDKKLGDLDTQVATASTQLLLQQFNSIVIDLPQGEMTNEEYAVALQQRKNAQIREFEDFAVDYLNRKMNNNNGDLDGKYEDSVVYENLSDFNYIVNALIDNSESRQQTLTGDILEAVKKYNKQNPDNQIASVDHANLRGIYEQYVASQLTKKGIKIEMAGNFMHQLPNMDGAQNKLKHREIAVSYKMFANTLAEANALLATAKRNGTQLDVVVVRIPASAEMSMFAGKVKYFLDTDSNAVMLSDKFVDVSDSDHDGDKAMVYRKHISKDGTISDLHTQSLMFQRLYNNLNSEEFLRKSTSNTLDLKSIEEAIAGTEGLSDKYVARVINEIADIAQKLGLGRDATGRFSLASKFMSLLSQEGESLHVPIEYKGKNGKDYFLKDFTTEQVVDLAKLLQAALDMANTPILGHTGFSKNTIDVGNVMMLLGVDMKEVIGFLSSEKIKEMSDLYDSSQIAFELNRDENGDVLGTETFSQFVERLYKGSANEDIQSFLKFKEIADGISKMISYVQLDKNLPGTSEQVDSLVEKVDDAKNAFVPFSIEGLKGRKLNRHREEILKLEKRILDSTTLTALGKVKAVLNKIGRSMVSPYAFEQAVEGQIEQYFSQFQIKTKRENAKEFVYEFPQRMKDLIESIASDEISAGPPSITKNVYDAISMAITQEQMDMIYREQLDLNKGVMQQTGLTRAKLDENLRKYDDKIKEISKNRVLKGNKFIEALIIREANGKLVMSMDGNYKGTKGMRNKMKDAFLEIQEINPQLANEFIDYQLYRYGLNDKIGSFLDALPVDMNVKMLAKATRFRNRVASNADMTNELSEMAINLVAKNKDSIQEVRGVAREIPGYIVPREKEGQYLVYKNKVYSRMTGEFTEDLRKFAADQRVYKEFGKGDFQADENFTAYNIAKFDENNSQSEFNKIKKDC